MIVVEKLSHLRSLPSTLGLARLTRRSWLVIVGFLLLAVSLSQGLIPGEWIRTQFLLERAYYIPIVLAGIQLGLRSSAATALIAAVSYATLTPPISTVRSVDLLDRLLEGCIFLTVGLVSGLLADRLRSQQLGLRKSTDEVHKLYSQLQENFEHMKRAERLCALGQLSAGLAHEVRNPLASIAGAARVLAHDPQTRTRGMEFLEIIQKECWRLNAFISSFLEFARPQTPDLKPTCLAELLSSVIALASHAPDAERISFRKEIRDCKSRLQCDPEQLKQVLINLTMNAMQAMPNGGEIVLSAEETHSEALIEIRDQGRGIQNADVDRIFDPFFTTKPGGSGLGLSVAHQIVAQHGGLLTISRNSSEGCTFRITLPLHARANVSNSSS